MEQMKRVLDASLLGRGLNALCRWFGGQWRASGVVQWFLHPGPLSRRAMDSSALAGLGRAVRGGCCRLYDRLGLERIFAGSVFLHSALWCALAVSLAPLLPTMVVLGLVLTAVASLLLELVRQRERRLYHGPMNKYVLAFAGTYGVAVILSVTPRGSLEHGAVLICFTLFALVVENALTTRRQALVFTGAVVVSGAAVSLVGVMQRALGVTGASSWVDSDMFSSITTRVYSTLQNPNMLAEYLVLILPLAAALLLTTRRRLGKLLWLGCLALTALCLVFTMSRGGWVGALIAGALFLMLLDPRLLALAPVGLVVMYFVLPETVISRFTSIGNLGDTSTSYRMSIWLGSLAMLKDYWLCGVGPGTAAFNMVYPSYGYNAANAEHSHSLLLQLVSDAGILALVLFLIAIFVFSRQLCAALSRCRGWRERAFPAAVLAGTMGFLAQGLTDYSFYNYRVALVFWAMLGLGTVWARTAGEEESGT